MPRKKKSETIIIDENNETTESTLQNDNIDDENLVQNNNANNETVDQNIDENGIDDTPKDVLKMTFDEYDALIEKLEKISYKPEGYYPTVQEIKDNLEPEFDKNFDYIVWLTECNEDPDTEEGILARNYLNRLLIKKLVLVDEEDLQKEGDET